MHQSPQEEIEVLQLRHPRDFSSKRLLRVSACPAECCTWTRLHSYRQRQGLCNWVLQDAVLIVLQQPMAFRAPLSQAQVKPSLSLVSGLHSSLGSNQAFFEKLNCQTHCQNSSLSSTPPDGLSAGNGAYYDHLGKFLLRNKPWNSKANCARM